MADRREDITEEASSSRRRSGHRSHRRQVTPDTQIPSQEVSATHTMDMSNEQEEDDIFKAQLLSVVDTFQKIIQDPRFARLMAGTSKPKSSPVREQSYHVVPSQVPSNDKGKRKVGEPAESLAPTMQPLVQAPGLLNGQASNEQLMRQAIQAPQAHLGYFGGGSVFQTMAGLPLLSQEYRPGNVFGMMQEGLINPLYANIGQQPGFQANTGVFGAPTVPFNAAEISGQQAGSSLMAGHTGDRVTGMPVPQAPLLQPPVFDQLGPLEKPKDYKECQSGQRKMETQ